MTMSRVEHVVLWDGRRSGPGGPCLFTEFSVDTGSEPVAAAPVRHARVEEKRAPVPMRLAAAGTSEPCRARVVTCLGRGPHTMRAIAGAIGIAPSVVNAALYQLRLNGVVKVVGSTSGRGNSLVPHFGTGAREGRRGAAIFALVVGGA